MGDLYKLGTWHFVAQSNINRSWVLAVYIDNFIDIYYL